MLESWKPLFKLCGQELLLKIFSSLQINAFVKQTSTNTHTQTHKLNVYVNVPTILDRIQVSILSFLTSVCTLN